MESEKRAKVLTISILRKVAELAIATDDEEVDRLQSELQRKAEELAILTGTDPNALILPIRKMAEQKRKEIDAGIAEEVAVALIVASVQAEAEFQEMVEKHQQNARERAAEKMDGEVREDEAPENKVDPNVLEGLATEVARN